MLSSADDEDSQARETSLARLVQRPSTSRVRQLVLGGEEGGEGQHVTTPDTRRRLPTDVGDLKIGSKTSVKEATKVTRVVRAR